MKIYLAGPINGRTDAECKGWRDYCKRMLGAEAVDPLDYDCRGLPTTGDLARDIVWRDKQAVSACDAMLVNWDGPSVGTSMEILYAWERSKRIVVVVDPARWPHDRLSPWLVHHATAIVPTLADAFIALREVQSCSY